MIILKDHVQIELKEAITDTQETLTFLAAQSPWTDPPQPATGETVELILTDSLPSPTKIEKLTATAIVDDAGDWSVTAIRGTPAHAFDPGAVAILSPTKALFDQLQADIENRTTEAEAVAAIKADDDWNAGNWDTAYNLRITGISGTGNSTLTLTVPDGTNLTQDLSHTHPSGEITGLGSLATKDPGGTANQLQTNDGSGGLAGIPVTQSDLALLGSENTWAERQTFQKDIRLIDGLGSIPLDSHPHVYRSLGGGTYPFDIFGHLIIQPRTDAQRDIVFVQRFGGTPAVAGRIDDIGRWEITDRLTIGSPAGSTPAGGINAEGVQVDGDPVGTLGADNEWTGIATFTNRIDSNRYRILPSSGAFWNIWGETSTNRLTFEASGEIPLTLTNAGRVGVNTTAPTERLDVDGNARVRGNIIADNATGHTIGGKAFQYDTETVTLGGDFIGSRDVKCVRVGDQVTITALSTLTHDVSGTLFNSAEGDIPPKYRPASEAKNVYGGGLSGETVRGVSVSTGGRLRLRYASSDNNSDSAPSITYNV